MAEQTEVASGYVSLYARLESSQVANEVSNALSKAFSGSAISDALSGFSSFSTKAGAALTAGLAVAAHKGMDVVGDLLNTISTTESADMALTTMFTPEFDMDSEAANQFAKEYIGWINNFAVETPFGFESALSGARTLVAMGFESTEVLDDMGEGVLRWSGDMASALGGDATTFNNIILQLGHMKSLGHVMSYQMNALARNGVPAWQAMAEYMNQYGDGLAEAYGLESDREEWDVETLRALAREGALSSDLGLDALEWYSNTHYEGMMEKESHTFRGIMMNMSDAIETPLRMLYDTDAWHGFTGSLYNLLDPIRKMITALLPTFELAFRRISPLIDKARVRIEEFTAKLEDGTIRSDQILGVIEGIVALLASGPLALAAGGVSGFFADIAESIEKTSQKATGSFGNMFQSFDKRAKKSAGTTKKLFEKFNASLTNFGKNMAIEGTFANKLKGGIGEAFGGGAKKLGADVKSLGSKLGGEFSRSFVSPLHGSISSALDKAKKKFDLSDAVNLDMGTKFDPISKAIYSSDKVKPIEMGLDPVQEQKRADAARKRIEHSMEKLRLGTSVAGSGLGLINTSEFEKIVNPGKIKAEPFWSSVLPPQKELLDRQSAFSDSVSKFNKKASRAAADAVEKTARASAVNAMANKALLDKASSMLQYPDAVEAETLQKIQKLHDRIASSMPVPDVKESTPAFKAMQTAATNATASIASGSTVAAASTAKLAESAASTAAVTNGLSESAKAVAASTEAVATSTKDATKSTSALNKAGQKLVTVGKKTYTTMKKMSVVTLAFSASAAKAAAVTSLSLFAGLSKILLIGGALVGVLAAVGTVAAGMFVAAGGNLANFGRTLYQSMQSTADMVAGVISGMTNAFTVILQEGQLELFFGNVNEGIRYFISTVGDLLPEFTLAFGEVFEGVVDNIISMIVEYGPTLLAGAINLFGALLNGLNYVIQTLVQNMPQIVSGIFTALENNGPRLLSSASLLFFTLVNAFSTTVPLVINELPGLISSLEGAFNSNKELLLSAAKMFFKTIALAIPQLIPIFVNTISWLLGQLTDAINDDDGTFFDKAFEYIGQIAFAIGQAMPVAVEKIGELVMALVDKLPQYLGDFLTAGAQFIFNLVNGFLGGEPVAIGPDGIGSVISNVLDTLAGAAGDFFNAALGWVGNLINGLFFGKTALGDEAGSTAEGTVDELAGHAGEFLNAAFGWIGNIINGIIDGAPTLLDQIVSTVGDAAGKFVEDVSGFVSAGGEWVTNVVSGITGLEDPFGKDIGGLVSGAVTAFGGTVADFAGVAGSWVSHIVSDITGLNDPFGENIGDLVSGAATAFKGVASDFAGVAGKWVEFVIASITGQSDPFNTDIGTLVSGAVTNFTGVASDFEGIASKWIGNIVTGLTGQDAEGMPLISQVGTIFSAVISGFTGVESDFIGLAGDWIQWLIDGLPIGGEDDPLGQKVKEVLGSVTSTLTDTAQTFIDISSGWITNLITGLTGDEENDPLITKIEGVVNGAITEAQAHGDDWVAAGSAFLGSLAQGVVDGATGFANGVWMTINSALENSPFAGAWDIAKSLFGATDDAVAQYGPNGGFSGIGSDIANDIVDGAIEGIEGNSDKLGGGGRSAGKAIEDGTMDQIEAHSPSRVFKRIGGYIVDGLNLGISNSDPTKSLPGMKSKITGFFTTSSSWLVTFGSSMASGLASGMTGNQSAVTNATNTLKTASSNALKGSDTYLKGHGGNLTTGLSNGMSDNSWRVTNAANALVSAAQASFTLGALWSSGANLMQGLINGINSKYDQVDNTVRAIANGAVNTVRNALWEHSPSRVMMQIGEYFTEGLAIGIASEQGLVEENAAGVANAAIDAVSDEFAPKRLPAATMYSDLMGMATYNGPSADAIALAMAMQMNGMGIYLSADETSAQLAPSMDRALGRLSYMEV